MVYLKDSSWHALSSLSLSVLVQNSLPTHARTPPLTILPCFVLSWLCSLNHLPYVLASLSPALTFLTFD